MQVSATTGKGVDHLLEMLALQADVLELAARGPEDALRALDRDALHALDALDPLRTRLALRTGRTRDSGGALQTLQACNALHTRQALDPGRALRALRTRLSLSASRCFSHGVSVAISSAIR